MRTLVQSITEYMRQGVRPVKFLRITDADTGTELLMQATAEHGDYEDRVASLGTITQEIAPEGGAASVSGMTIDGLYCDKRLPLCTEAELAPKYEGVTCGAGRAICTNAVYDSARNAGAGTIASAAIVAGRNYTGSEYSVIRGYLQFEVPDDLATCEDVYLELSGVKLYSPDTTLTLVLVEGTWVSLYLTGGTVYSSFDGWAGSGAYTVSALNETWTTAEYGTTNYIRLNEAGRDYVASCAGGVAKFALLTTRDTLNASAPTGKEFVVFEAATARLNLRYNSITLDNQIAEVYYALRDSDGNLPDDHTGMDLVWKGVIDSYTLNDRILSLTLRQNNFAKDKLIPAEVITEDDWPDCPEENIGKAIPIVYGDFIGDRLHKDGIASFLNGANRYGNGPFAKGLVYSESGGTLSVIVAGHTIKNSSFMAAIYSSSIKSFVLASGDVINITEDDATTGKFTVSPGTAGVFPYKLTSGDDDEESAVQLQGIASYIGSPINNLNGDEKNATNADWSDWTEVSTGEYANEYQFYNTYGESGLYNLLAVVFETYAENGYDSKLKLTMHFYDSNNVLGERAIDIDSDGQHIFYISRDDAFTLANDTVRLAVYFSYHTKKTFKFRNLCVLRGFSRDIETEIYIPIQGRMDDSSGTITGTANALIENPAHIIEAFARNEMGLATAEIDTSAVDAAYTACGDAVLGFQLNEQEKASEILNDIAYQSRLMVFYDHENRLSCKKVNSSDTFPVSGADYPALLDTFDATGTPSSGSFTTHPLMGEVEISQMELDETYDSFAINYRMNYATNDYTKTITCDKDGFSADASYLGSTVEAELVALCSACYDRIKTVNTLTVDCDKIMDDNTAHLLVEHLVRWFSKRRDKVEFSAAHTAMLFTLGDLINVQSARLDDRYGVATARVKKWLLTKIVHNLDTDTFTFTAIEV